MEVFIYIALTGFLWGIGPLFEKYALKSFSSESLLFLRVIIATVFISIFFFAVSSAKQIMREFTWPAFNATVASGIIGFAGLYFFYRLISMPDASVSRYYAITLAISPLITAVLAYFYLGEPIFKVEKILGILFVVSGIYLLSYQTHA